MLRKIQFEKKRYFENLTLINHCNTKTWNAYFFLLNPSIPAKNISVTNQFEEEKTGLLSDGALIFGRIKMCNKILHKHDWMNA